MARIPLISIVDDDDALRNSLDDLIRSIGFRTQGFASAEAFMSSNKARDTACLILDVRMPGMNGLELQRQLLANNSGIPIIFITSHVDDNTRERALAAGAVDFLYKPFGEDVLLKAIDSALNNH
jgi:two-component system, LuxR family, response regulator FixJ